MSSLSLERIIAASKAINPVFLRTPQYQSTLLSHQLGLDLICKVETINPIGCFKGRGADWWVKCHPHVKNMVCVSAGNFGLAMAYAAKQNGMQVHVFSIEKANPIKMQAIQAVGAQVHLIGDNYDIVRKEAAHFADKQDAYLIVDGKEMEITEGAGTMGMELSQYERPLDSVFVPIADGALIGGIGSWLKTHSPDTKIIGVCAAGAPAMQQSWQQSKIISAKADTIADGIGINTPLSEGLSLVKSVADDVVLVEDAQIIQAMKLLYEHEHLVTEPAGATALAAVIAQASAYQDKTVAMIITGANINPLYQSKWLQL